MFPEKTAVLLVGFQKDYFDKAGRLRPFVEESITMNNVVETTVNLIQNLPASTLIVSTPINFTDDYRELENPVGILKQIRDLGALRSGSVGSQIITELHPFSEKIVEVHGKRGFNAFAHTHLDKLLKDHEIEHVVVAGTITSICIDSTGRYAHELGYDVTILSDCTAARTVFEQKFYCESIFPVYANVTTHRELLHDFAIAA